MIIKNALSIFFVTALAKLYISLRVSLIYEIELIWIILCRQGFELNFVLLILILFSFKFV